MKKRMCTKANEMAAVFVAFLCLLFGMGQAVLIVHAAEGPQDVTELSQIMVAEEEIEMKAAPDEESETLMIYEKGASVFVTSEAEDGWYRVIYQDKAGYIKEESLRAQKIDVEGLDAEMQANAQEGKYMVEAVEKYRVEARRSKIWGSVIIVLVVGIFGIGIFSALRTQRYEDERGAKKRRDDLQIQDLDLEGKS